jgi:hypothetical protein
VTGRPIPVSAKFPSKTAFMSVLLPTPGLPAIRMFTCPRSLSVSITAFEMVSDKLKDWISIFILFNIFFDFH